MWKTLWTGLCAGVSLTAKGRQCHFFILRTELRRRWFCRPTRYSLQQKLRQGLQPLLHGSVGWRQVLSLHDDRVGLLEEVLPHRSFHALAPRSQLRPAFEDVTAGADRLWEREPGGGVGPREAQGSMSQLRDPLGGFSLLCHTGDRLGLLLQEIPRSCSISLQGGVFKPLFTDEDAEAQRGK